MHRYHTCVHVLRTIRSTSNGMLWKKQKEPRKRTGQFEWNTMQWNAMERKIKCANISNIIGKCSAYENMGNVIVAIFCTCICHTHKCTVPYIHCKMRGLSAYLWVANWSFINYPLERNTMEKCMRQFRTFWMLTNLRSTEMNFTSMCHVPVRSVSS